MAKFPLPAFTFGVWLGNTEITFKEVTGIKATIEYKRDTEGGENLSHSKIPERVKFDPVVLKKGLVQDSSLFRDLIKDKFNIDITTPGNNLIQFFIINCRSKHSSSTICTVTSCTIIPENS